MEFIKSIKEINLQIAELNKQKCEIISNHSKEILDKVFRMMDWDKSNVSRSSVEYSSFEKRIMIEVFLKNDSNARYVFELNGKGEISLRFREDFSMC